MDGYAHLRQNLAQNLVHADYARQRPKELELKPVPFAPHHPGLSSMYGLRQVMQGGQSCPAIERTRALVVGCNYQGSKGLRLWGACADAHDWASTLTSKIGLPSRNVTLLVDETPAGDPKLESEESFPSQSNILWHLQSLTSDATPGCLLIFIFCGRGTLLLDGITSTGADQEEEDPADDQRFVEEGLLCGDFESDDVRRGYTMRMITTRAAAEMWENLPAGASLLVITDCQHGASILPVSRRLDSAQLPADAKATPHPLPPLSLGVSRSFREVKHALRSEALAGTPDLVPTRDARDSKNVWPQGLWLRGQMPWSGSDDLDLAALMHPDVQAFSFCACAPGGHAFESLLGEKGGTRGKGGPAGRRGVLTHCLLQALTETDCRGSYYDLWLNAVRILRSKNIPEQHFQMAFSNSADPTICDVFAPLSYAEAFARARRSGDDEALHCLSSGEVRSVNPWMDDTLECDARPCDCTANQDQRGLPWAYPEMRRPRAPDSHRDDVLDGCRCCTRVDEYDDIPFLPAPLEPHWQHHSRLGRLQRNSPRSNSHSDSMCRVM
jgi:hypothetical protein